MKSQTRCRLNAEAVGMLIREQSLKLWWVAEASGIHKTTLRRWLSGDIERMTRTRVERLADVLQRPVAELVQ
jgi:Helix-turn-helix domain